MRLLEVGVAAFLENGYHGTGIKEVLDKVNVPKGSFYNYFGSKEEFAAVVVRHYAKCFVQKMDRVIEGVDSPSVGLRRFFEQLMQEFEATGFTGGCLIANLGGELEGSEVCRQELFEGFRNWSGRVAEVLAEGQRQGEIRTDIDPQQLANLLTDSWEGGVIRMKIERSLEPLQRIIDRLLEGYFQP